MPEYRDAGDGEESTAGHTRSGGQDERTWVTEILAEATSSVTDADATLGEAGRSIREAQAQLCRACVNLLSVTGASISIAGSMGVRATWCASDPTAARLAEAQYTLGGGPCQSALDAVAPVFAPDLTRGSDVRRWPFFAQQAIELGVKAAFSLPLGSSVLAIGTLDLYRTTPGRLSDRDLRIALLACDAITFTVLKLHSGSDAANDGGVASWLDAAEADHDEVHLAVGMVMIQLNVDPQQALDRLRARAFAQSRTVTEVARDVVARTARFHD
ncbi:GAF and ANTAR domain-containing protein [Streptomyces sp. 21So2-11]|uniref:GAF and ANTAR domain-containing protein n=1 Tax=Streptomyces sp. 21So2-11 TaxID=3144408 RepID=UPI00321AF714